MESLKAVQPHFALDRDIEFFFVLRPYRGRDFPLFTWKTEDSFKDVLLISDPLLLSLSSYKRSVLPCAGRLFIETEHSNGVLFFSHLLRKEFPAS